MSQEEREELLSEIREMQRPKGPFGNVPQWLAIVVSIVAMAIAGYVGTQTGISDVNVKIEKLNTNFSSFEKYIDEQGKSHDHRLEKVEDRETALETGQEALRARMTEAEKKIERNAR